MLDAERKFLVINEMPVAAKDATSKEASFFCYN
jgi:hypothetical protein